VSPGAIDRPPVSWVAAGGGYTRKLVAIAPARRRARHAPGLPPLGARATGAATASFSSSMGASTGAAGAGFSTAGTGAATAGAAAPGEKEKDAADGLKLNEVAVGLKLNDVAAAGGVAPVAPPASSCADSQSAPGQSAILMRMCAERVGQGHV
jgi:hypothetical protein